MSQRYLGGIITANPTAPTLTSASGVWTTEQQFQNIANWPKSTGLVSRSVRLRSSASAYFNRTPASAGNLKTWTVSLWVKRGLLSNAAYALFGTGANNTNDTICYFGPSGTGDQLDIIVRASSTIQGRLTTTQQFRDPSAWYHIVFAYNSPDATASERMKLYVNGVRVTAFSSETQPAQNTDSLWNTARALYFGRMRDDSPNYLDGYLTEINFIDGQALTPSYFGFTDGNGVWQPATYSGTYGTNGFYLNFSDNSGVTATTIGKDYSGNGNNWTPNNISVTAGVTYDSMLDVPTPYADGGNGRGNYSVLNPVNVSGGGTTTITDGNLATSVGSTTTFGKVLGSVGMSTGKWYWEVLVTAVGGAGNIGIGDGTPPSGSFGLGGVAGEISYQSTGNKYTNNSSTAYGATYTTNDLIGVAYDADAGSITFYKNNASQGAITGFSGTKYAAVGSGGGTNPQYAINFGQRPFTYTPPTGFVALNTQNLPTPTISNGAQYMAATTYTGNGSTQTINNSVNGVSFAPNLVWVKVRSSAATHGLIDSVRGAGIALASNLTDAERNNGTGAGGDVIAFNSNGFNLGNNTTGSATNSNLSGSTYVGWQWNAGGSTVTNTNGSISAQVRANTTAGFSVVTYTGNATSGATVGHGLGVAPKMIIVKRRDAATNWPVWHTSISSGTNDFVQLNLTTAKVTDATFFTSTAPTSSVFSLGTGSGQTNTGSMVAYCFAAVAGYSAFGSYTGNGSADGPFVYLGFRPRFVMWKRTDAVANWFLMDSSRTPANPVNLELYADQTNAEVTFTDCDFLSNGFKLRTSDSSRNASGGTYIYAAFAENPFKLSRAR